MFSNEIYTLKIPNQIQSKTTRNHSNKILSKAFNIFINIYTKQKIERTAND